ncbi:MAG TPA: hypothetical protein VMV17_02150 [Streptosporangiaceae bacterium]|nr:hypothetical protein [Streptosporangiaceae bacterium]
MREEEDRLRQGHRPEPPPDFGEILKSMQSRTSVRREARDAVIARSAGKSRREIRQLLIEELLSRRLEIPSESILDADVDFITQGAGPLTAAKQVLRALAAVRTARREIARMFKDAQIMRGPTGKAAYFVIPDRSRPMVDVILDPGAYQLLTTSPEPIPVSLESEKPTSRGTARVIVYAGTYRVGALSDLDSSLYKPALDAAQREDQTLMVMSVINLVAGGTLRLQIYPAGIL